MAIFTGIVLLAAFLWTLSHSLDEGRVSVVARSIVYVVAIPAQVLLATLRIATVHDFGFPALILGVICAELLLFLFVRVVTRKTREITTPRPM